MHDDVSAAAFTASCNGASRGAVNGPAAGRENLQIHMVMAGIDGGHDRKALVVRHMRRRVGRSVDTPTAGLSAASAMPRAAAMPTRKPGEASGAGGHRDAVDVRKGQARRLHHPLQQRQQAPRRGRGPSAGFRWQRCRRYARCRARPPNTPPAPYQWRVRA